MKELKKFKEYQDMLKQHESKKVLLEFRNVPHDHVDQRSSMKMSTIRKILKKTSYVAGESLYAYNVLKFLMSKRIV